MKNICLEKRKTETKTATAAAMTPGESGRDDWCSPDFIICINNHGHVQVRNETDSTLRRLTMPTFLFGVFVCFRK